MMTRKLRRNFPYFSFRTNGSIDVANVFRYVK